MADLVPTGGEGPATPSPAFSTPTVVKQRRISPLFWVLLVLLVGLLLIGLGSIGYYALLTQQQNSANSWSDAWDSLDPEQISAGLIIWSLAGGEPEQIYRQAMAGDSLESATAISLTTPTLPDIQRLGWLSVLARRFAITGDRAQAELLYQVAADLALLSTGLGDNQRAEALLAVANGWVDLDKPKRGRDLLQQVTTIAQSSPELTAPIRRQLLENAAETYERLRDIDQAQTTRALPADLTALPTPHTTVDLLATLENPLTYSDQVLAFQAARVMQAQAYVDTWIEREGSTSATQTAALATALIDEDLVRAAYYEQMLGNESLPSSLRAQVLWDKIQWLAIKHQAAKGLYGVDLAPNWVAEKPAIRQTLHDAFIELSELLVLQNQTLPPEQQAEALTQVYSTLLVWSRIGLYPDADQVFLANALNDTLDQWSDAFGIFPQTIIGEDGEVKFDVRVIESPQG